MTVVLLLFGCLGGAKSHPSQYPVQRARMSGVSFLPELSVELTDCDVRIPSQQIRYPFHLLLRVSGGVRIMRSVRLVH